MKQEAIRLYRFFLVPALIFLVIIILGATLGQKMVAGIFDTRNKIAELKKTNKILSAKKETLNQIDKGDYTRKAKLVILAIPDEPSGLSSIASLRAIATQSGVKLENLKVFQTGTENVGNLGQVSISFQVRGAVQAIISYLEKVENSVPFIQMKKISLSQTESLSDATLDVNSFWANLPDTLPSLETPIEQLTSSEEELVSRLSTLEQSLGAQASPLPPEGRTNPFAF